MQNTIGRGGLNAPPSSRQNRREPDDARRLAVGESVIKLCYASERAQYQLWSYVYLGMFSGDGHLMTESP